MSEGLIVPFSNTPCGTKGLILSLSIVCIIFEEVLSTMLEESDYFSLDLEPLALAISSRL